MKHLASRLLASIGCLVTVMTLSGCASVALSASTIVSPGNPAPAVQVNAARVTEMALNALEGWNAGDYGRWARDWSPSLKASVAAADFIGFRDRYFDRYGRCFAITRAESSPSPRAGFMRWAFDVECQRGLLRFTFAFAGGEQIESVYVDPQG